MIEIERSFRLISNGHIEIIIAVVKIKNEKASTHNNDVNIAYKISTIVPTGHVIMRKRAKLCHFMTSAEESLL